MSIIDDLLRKLDEKLGSKGDIRGAATARSKAHASYEKAQEAYRDAHAKFRSTGSRKDRIAADSAEARYEEAYDAREEARSTHREARGGAGRINRVNKLVEDSGANQAGGLVGYVADKWETTQLGLRAATGDPTAIAQLAVKKAKQVQEAITDIGTGAGEAAMSNKGGHTMAGMFKSAGGAAKLLTAGEDNPLSWLAKMGQVAGDTIEKLRSWGEHLHNADMQFASVSGSMANVMAQQEVRQILLDQERGERRAESADKRERSMHELNKEMAIWEDAAKGWWDSIISPIADAATGAGKTIRGWFGDEEDRKEETHTMWDALQHEAASAWTADWGRPGRFK